MRGARGASPSSAPGSGLLRGASPSRRASRAKRKPRQAKRRGRIRKERTSNRGPGVRRYDKARIRRTRALCTAVRLARYGERLVCVRYRYDSATGRRVKTAELIVQDIAWAGRARKPRRNDHDLVGVRIDWKESELRAAVKRAGGIWRPRQRLWELSWDAVRTLGCTAGSSKNLPGQS